MPGFALQKDPVIIRLSSFTNEHTIILHHKGFILFRSLFHHELLSSSSFFLNTTDVTMFPTTPPKVN